MTGEAKGDATVTYEDPHTAKSAIQWFNGKEMTGTSKVINVEYAQRKAPSEWRGRGAPFGRGGPRGGRGGGGPPGGPRGDPAFMRQGDWR